MTTKRAVFVLLFLAALGGVWASAQEEPEYSDPEALGRLIEDQNEQYILIDVRTDAEYGAGYIPTAVNIPFDILADNLPTEDRRSLIIVYCRSGRRSAIAYDTLADLGFTRIFDFGGISRWSGELAVPVN